MTSEGRGLHVVKPGLHTLLQDRGRFGYQHLGLTTGGAADEHAFLWANHLLNNAPDCAVLEVCFGGLVLEAQVATQAALTGADLQASINQTRLRPWQSFRIQQGDRIEFGYAKTGVQAYLAVNAGFNVSPTYGSVATVMREGIGGLDGRGNPLRAGDFLPCIDTPAAVPKQVRADFRADYSRPLTLRLVEGQQVGLFDRGEMRRFYNCDYQISQQSSRMGMRLEGPPLTPSRTGIVSEGISFGAVQVPADGQPIVLLKERQTIGGYPKLGTVFALDAFELSQRRPGTRVRFEQMALAEAQRELKEFYRFFLG